MTAELEGDRVLRHLLDQRELHDLVARLHRGFDRLDDELIISCLAPGFRYATRTGFTAEEFAAHVRRMHTEDFVGTGLQLRSTQHAIANELYEVSGDTAYGEIYSRFYGVTIDGELISRLLRYVDRYVRDENGWRLAERDAIFEWASPELGSRTGSSEGRRDRSDAVYSR